MAMYRPLQSYKGKIQLPKIKCGTFLRGVQVIKNDLLREYI